MNTLFSTYAIHHVGIVIPSLESASAFAQSMDLEEDYRGFVPQWTCWCIFMKGSDNTTIELVVPEDGPLKRFNKGAGGVHHFALQVDDIEAVSAELRSRGSLMLEREAIKGAGQFLCNFINPISTRGIQIELVQPF